VFNVVSVTEEIIMQRIGKMLILLVNFAFTLTFSTAFAQEDPAAEEVTIPGVVEKTVNGVTTTDIAGTLFRALNGDSLHPAILMLPQLMDMSSEGAIISPREPLADLARQFAAQGVHALTIDMSGYRFPGTGTPSMLDGVQDAQAAFNWLVSQPGVDPEQVSVLGTSYGANFALLLMAQEAAIKTGLIFSPDSFMSELNPDPAALADRPILVYAGANEAADPAYLAFLEQFGSVSAPADGHGLFIFQQGGFDAEMQIWLEALKIRQAVESGEISREEGFDQMMALAEFVCGPFPFFMVGGGLLVGIRRRRKTAHAA
jgi:dienelactone hydrolase